MPSSRLRRATAESWKDETDGAEDRIGTHHGGVRRTAAATTYPIHLPTGGQGPWIRDQFRLIHQKSQGHFSRKRFQSGTKLAVSGTSPRA